MKEYSGDLVKDTPIFRIILLEKYLFGKIVSSKLEPVAVGIYSLVRADFKHLQVHTIHTTIRMNADNVFQCTAETVPCVTIIES